MSMEDVKSVETVLSNNAFIHMHQSDLTTANEDVCLTFRCTEETDPSLRFKRVTIDTAANRRSIMSEQQYQAYQDEFGRRVPMRPPRKDIKWIGGKSKAIGKVTIQIPFVCLNLMLDI